jgi:hypothetical protein
MQQAYVVLATLALLSFCVSSFLLLKKTPEESGVFFNSKMPHWTLEVLWLILPIVLLGWVLFPH